MRQATFVVVGGGIAGVSCAEGLGFLAPEENVILIAASPLIKAVTNVVPLAKTVMKFDVTERSSASLIEQFPSISVINDLVAKIDGARKIVITGTGEEIRYKKLCICTGGRPKLICENNPRVIGIRDTESVENFLEKLRGSKRIVVVGNGGIATELVHDISGLEVIWAIKDKHISAAFVDPGAAQFFQEKLMNKQDDDAIQENPTPSRRMKYVVDGGDEIKNGPALGPDWHRKFDLKEFKFGKGSVIVEYECEVEEIKNSTDKSDFWPIFVKLSNGKKVGCDLVVSATGVVPNSELEGLEQLKRAPDKGLLVDWKLETSEADIYAAGDVCTANWEIAEQWFQMRLWTQAHQMGQYAAKSMASSYKKEEFLQDFCFELFTHVTKFFGYKVVLLGLYNGQKLNDSYELLLRVTNGSEYIKLVLKDGKMQGAVLIGETDIEEMCENLILNQLDLSMYGEDLLNPDIDIEDYFD